MSAIVKKMLAILLGIFLFVGGLVACTGVVTKEITKGFDKIATESVVEDSIPPSSVVGGLPGLYEFEEIEAGMAIEEVKSILGEPFSIVKHEVNGKNHEIMTYSAKGGITSSITITLVDGAVESKEQVDLVE